MKNIVITACAALALPSCMVAHERVVEGKVLTSVAMLGTDADALIIQTANGGISAQGLDNSTGLKFAGRAITGLASIGAFRDVGLATQATARHQATQETLRHAATEKTAQATVQANAGVLTAVGGNPEASPAVIEAVGGAIRQ